MRQLDVPIAFFVFNRPETTKRVFERIRAVRPRQLLIIADGPRHEHLGEADVCTTVRSLIEAGVDWPCDVQRNYSESNLGCGRRVSSGLDWVFGRVETAIILEDDCLPDPIFFDFCAELLTRYREDLRIGAIAGDNFQRKDVTGGKGYYFSKYTHCWGWATWRRAWKYYDYSIADWPERKRSKWLRAFFKYSGEAEYWERIFDQVYRNEFDTWDYQWAYANWKNNSLTALPAANLVTNIGFGPRATHTRNVVHIAALSHGQQPWPLQPAVLVEKNEAADRYAYLYHFNSPFWLRAWRKLRLLQ